MGKQGPCRHCGVTSTPLWRNGPPEKPVLCNACGSRWRTKGSLTNYTPLHARELLDSEEFKVSKVRSIYLKAKDEKSYKKKQNYGFEEIDHEMPYSDQNFRKIFDGDTSNRSSSGSAISYSESCAHFGNTDASDLTDFGVEDMLELSHPNQATHRNGSAQSNVWDSLVPSKKRTCVTRPKPSPVEKLTKDLYSILHEQQSSYLSGSSEEDLLYESGTPIGSAEIGHGGVLLRYPNSKSVEEESEASSLPIDNKSYIINESYSGSASFLVHSESKGTSYSNIGTEKFKKPTTQMAQGHVKRDKVSHEKLNILRDRASPLSSTDLKDIATFDVFMKHTTHEEQQRLMRYLPSTETMKCPESLKSMFQSPQFVETFSYFQELLLEGIFDLSFLGADIEESRALKRLVLLNLSKSKWVEHYKKLKEVKHKRITGGKKIVTSPNFLGYSDLTPLKRPRDSQIQHCQVEKGTMRSPKRVSKPGDMNLPSTKSSQLKCSDAGSKVIHDADDFIDSEEACFSPRSIFASPPDRSSMLGSLQFTDESSDQDLLLDVPSNASFPEAELLSHPWNRKAAPNSSPAESGIGEGEERLSNNPSSSFSDQHQRHR